MANISFKTERDKIVYEEKLTEIHKGPCSSPRLKTCPCTDVCPIHGRCCDCVRHHISHKKTDMDKNDYSWLPYCLRHVDELNDKERSPTSTKVGGVPEGMVDVVH